MYVKHTEPVITKTSSRSHKPSDRARFAAALSLTSRETLFHLPTCEQQLNFFNSSIRMLLDNSSIRILLDTHLPEREIRLIGRRQNALLSGNQLLYRLYRNKANRERKSLQRKYYQRKIQSLENEHPKQWWNNVKDLAGVKVKCDNLQGLVNKHCSGNLDIFANDICDFFNSVSNDFTPLSPNDTFLSPEADTTIPDAYIINVNEVAKSLSRVKTDKAVGPDEIPNWILHDYGTILAPPICAIFNSGLRERTVPMLWKCADIRPIPKVRPTLIHKDLRPISLTPVLSKCLEKFICDWITDITSDQVDPINNMSQ